MRAMMGLRRWGQLLAVPAVLLGTTACAGVAFQGQGMPIGLYVSTDTASHTTANNIGKKKGEACAMSILGLITLGDAGLKAAATAGGITQISAVDVHSLNVLGIYAKMCTVVSGDAEAEAE